MKPIARPFVIRHGFGCKGVEMVTLSYVQNGGIFHRYDCDNRNKLGNGPHGCAHFTNVGIDAQRVATGILFTAMTHQVVPADSGDAIQSTTSANVFALWLDEIKHGIRLHQSGHEHILRKQPVSQSEVPYKPRGTKMGQERVMTATRQTAAIRSRYRIGMREFIDRGRTPVTLLASLRRQASGLQFSERRPTDLIGGHFLGKDGQVYEWPRGTGIVRDDNRYQGRNSLMYEALGNSVIVP